MQTHRGVDDAVARVMRLGRYHETAIFADSHGPASKEIVSPSKRGARVFARPNVARVFGNKLFCSVTRHGNVWILLVRVPRKLEARASVG